MPGYSHQTISTSSLVRLDLLLAPQYQGFTKATARCLSA
jgi:hypothetical protein